MTRHQINFIPAEVTRKAYRKQLIPWAVVTLLVSSGAVAGSAYLLDRVSLNLKRDIELREGEVTQVVDAKQAETSSTLGTRLASMTARTNALNSLALTEADWRLVFAKVEEIIPQDITLNTYTAGSTATGFQVRMSGTAPSNLSMAAFVGLLKGNKDLTKQTVESYSYSPGTGKVSFTVAVEFQQSLVLFKRSK